MKSYKGKWDKKTTTFIFPEDVNLKDLIKNIIDNKGNYVDPAKTFNFFPTPEIVVEKMLHYGISLNQLKKDNIVEPSAGKGDIIKYLIKEGINPKHIFACEINKEFHKLLEKLIPKDNIIGDDFLTLGKDDIEHHNIQYIIANPPFSDKRDIIHINHMVEIATEGTDILSLMSPTAKRLFDDYQGYNRSSEKIPRNKEQKLFVENVENYRVQDPNLLEPKLFPDTTIQVAILHLLIKN
jgi:phospholipid N-methyltransferase